MHTGGRFEQPDGYGEDNLGNAMSPHAHMKTILLAWFSFAFLLMYLKLLHDGGEGQVVSAALLQ